MPRRLLIFLLLATFSLGYTSPTTGERGSNAPAKSVWIRRIVKADGWEIPGLNRTRIVQPRKSFSVPQHPELEFYETLFASKQDADDFEDFVMVVLPFYYVTIHDNTLSTREVTVRVDFIHRYDYRSQTFCYDVMSTQYNHDPKTGGGGFGPVWNVRFYDMDGDGRFETMEFMTTATPLSIPDWVAHAGTH